MVESALEDVQLAIVTSFGEFCQNIDIGVEHLHVPIPFMFDQIIKYDLKVLDRYDMICCL